ncbi:MULTISPECIES: hypothetical protein [Pseudomonas]|uniref:hypothetical protein n=1 Tax=Pseudomonas nitroreducens TaxID=46680 RepID=UPI001E474059|nr:MULTISPECIES: hypothetical protein [Pseudomonas]MCE4073412.1 hypothetical protein [Pseudomonas nitritireducens]MCE4079708.1 hypothetical protein [Pseudomonas nitroreducens]
MKQQAYTYGDSVIEFFPFNPDELQESIQQAESKYYNAIANLDNQLAANVQLPRAPLVVQLPELFKLIERGYTVHPNKFCGVMGQSLDITLIKPQKVIDKELAQVHAEAESSYNSARFERNRVETERQLQITTDRKQRDREKALAAAEQKRLAEETEQALQELREAYAAA